MRAWAWMRGWLTRGWEAVKDSLRYLVESPARIGAVLAATLVGLIVGAPVGDGAYDYMWRDPYFCDDCHSHDYADEAWARSIHGGVTTCHDCHKVPLMHYPGMTANAVLNPPQNAEEVGNAHVPSVICEACHLADSTEHLTGPMTDEMRTQIVKIDESPLHERHMESATRDPGTYLGADHGEHGPDAEPVGEEEHAPDMEGEGAITCMDCHGSGGDELAHRFTAARSNCLACHGGMDVDVGRLTELRCRECHYTGFVGHRPEPITN